jgi:hypothetical protein
VTVKVLDEQGGEDVFTWILIVWATRGVVIRSVRSHKPSWEERREGSAPRGRQKQKIKYHGKPWLRLVTVLSIRINHIQTISISLHHSIW